MPGERQKRRSERLQHEVLVAYRTVDGFVSDWAVNISKGGLFINSRNPQPVGTIVRLLLSLPGMEAAFPFDLIGRVTRVSEYNNPTNEVPGMAIEFIDIDEAKRKRIGRFVEKLRGELSPESKKVDPSR